MDRQSQVLHSLVYTCAVRHHILWAILKRLLLNGSNVLEIKCYWGVAAVDHKFKTKKISFVHKIGRVQENAEVSVKLKHLVFEGRPRITRLILITGMIRPVSRCVWATGTVITSGR